MATIYGKRYTRKKLLARVGDISQIAGAQLLAPEEGRARGVRVVRVRTGAGLTFDVAVDRGMDIIDANYNGAAIGWRTPVQEAAPSFHEPYEFGFLRTFPGGLLVTCGLDHFGMPTEDDGERFGLHGRVSHTPATELGIQQEWVGDEYVISVRGVVTQYRLFGEHLRLTRTITTSLGSTAVLVEDEVHNAAYRPQPHMILYHCNFGWPLVDETAEIVLGERASHARDDEAARDYTLRRKMEPPKNHYPEQCFFYDLKADTKGNTVVSIVNRDYPGGGLAAYLCFNRKELPYMVEWKNMAAGNYVVGLEPTNCSFKTREELRRSKEMPVLAPGKSANYTIELGVVAGDAGLKDLVRHIKKLK